TISVDKKVYGPADEVKVSFKLKNETDRDLFIGDGYLGPAYQETGPGRHFELHVTADDRSPLDFWTRTTTEGHTSGSRKVLKLEPGQTYEGAIRISAGAARDRKAAERPHEERGGFLEDKTTHKNHVFGVDGRKYSVELHYQVNPKSHGVWEPPADFKDELLWKGTITSGPVVFEIAAP